jgi:trigger factor
MKTIVERESPTKVRLLVEVASDELAPFYEETVRRLGREVKVPGFRKGKVPKAVLETRMSRDAIRQEMLRDSLPKLYAEAVKGEEVRAVTLPDIEVTSFEEGTPLTFTATVEVRPEINLPQYKGIEVTRPDSAATDEEIDEQVERLRQRFGSLEPVARNAARGDYVTIDLKAYQHDVKIDEASAEDFLYEVGSAAFVPELDDELEGKRTGDILKLNAKLPESFASHPGEEVSFSVIVKEVHAKRLPALDDDFAKTASEFDTLEELKADLRNRIEAAKKIEAGVEVRNRILEDLISRADVPLPESMVAHETQHRIERLVRDLQRAGLTLDKYLEAGQRTQEQLVAAYREVAEKSLAADLILDAVAKAEGIEAAPEEVSKEVAMIAESMEADAAKLEKDLADSGRLNAVAGDILRRKALDYLVEHANLEAEALKLATS